MGVFYAQLSFNHCSAERLGTGARFWLSGFIAQRYGSVFPFRLLFPVNVTGCFIIGIFAAFTESDRQDSWSHPRFRQFFMIGVCGGYTTFSSFGLQTLDLVRGWRLVECGTQYRALRRRAAWSRFGWVAFSPSLSLPE